MRLTAPFGVKRQDAGGNIFEDGFDQLAAAFEFLERLAEGFA